MLIAINHHYIRSNFDQPFPGINGITPEQFKQKLEALSLQGSFVSANDISLDIDGSAALPEKSIIITFDDGLKEQYDWALPVLEKMGIPALFFINTINLSGIVSNVHKIHLLRSSIAPEDFSVKLHSFIKEERLESLDLESASRLGAAHYIYDDALNAAIKYILNFSLTADKSAKFIDKLFSENYDEQSVAAELYMNNQQVTQLHERGFLGAHGHEHLPLGQLPLTESTVQVSMAQKVIKKVSGKEVKAFSYPYGSDASCKDMEIPLQQSGFKFAFTMKRAANHNLKNPFYLSRFDNNDMPLGKASRFPAGVNIFDYLKEKAVAG